MFTPESIGQCVSTYALELAAIAVPEAQVYSNPAVLHEMFEWPYYRVVLYVVLGSPRDLRLEYAGQNVQRRWEVQTRPGGSLFYTWKDGGGSFDEGDSEHSAHKDLYERSRRLVKGSVKGLRCTTSAALRYCLCLPFEMSAVHIL
ncbi:hypothetical protein GB937_004350 [Aspergillus fischeri]|nr:hypothetical protein GB937_004350 [Aspergillus fischeri]